MALLDFNLKFTKSVPEDLAAYRIESGNQFSLGVHTRRVIDYLVENSNKYGLEPSDRRVHPRNSGFAGIGKRKFFYNILLLNDVDAVMLTITDEIVPLYMVPTTSFIIDERRTR